MYEARALGLDAQVSPGANLEGAELSRFPQGRKDGEGQEKGPSLLKKVAG